MSYTFDILNSFIEKDKAFVNVVSLPKLQKEAIIPFTCHCGTPTTKRFVRIKISGLLCEECTKQSKKEKIIKTNLEKYGVPFTTLHKETQEKAKQTAIKHFGVDNIFKVKEIQEQIKQDNLAKYGVENPFAAECIKEKIKNTCKIKYGEEYPMKNKEVCAKVKQTNLEKYGTEVSSKAECVKEKAIQTNQLLYGEIHHNVPEVIEKIKKTNNKKYGVEYSFQAEIVKEKIKKTIQEKYGVEHISQNNEIKEKVKQTNIKKYGFEYATQSLDIKNKVKSTCFKKYGCFNANQSPEIQERNQKNGLRYKTYITPSGEHRKVQGYEPFALDKLFKELHYSEDNVITDRKYTPKFYYNIQEKKKIYYPDIYIPSENKIIEVKSSWTFNLNKHINEEKQKACVKDGYVFEFWIFDKKGKLTVQNEV
jgi:hypothetical protein